MTYSMHPTPSAWSDYATIAASLGADLVSATPDGHGKTVLALSWPDGCTSIALLMDQGAGTVRLWPEIDLGQIEFAATYERHGHYWFVNPSDIPASTGCREHVSEHWRAQNTAAAASLTLV